MSWGIDWGTLSVRTEFDHIEYLSDKCWTCEGGPIESTSGFVSQFRRNRRINFQSRQSKAASGKHKLSAMAKYLRRSFRRKKEVRFLGKNKQTNQHKQQQQLCSFSNLTGLLLVYLCQCYSEMQFSAPCNVLLFVPASIY